MARHLFTVEDVFAVRGRGLVLVPGILAVGDERFRVGDPLVLRKPDGTSATARIAGLEPLDPNPRYDLALVVRGLAKPEVPAGTEVWSADAVR